ncbi:hypothetical protein [Chitinophaga varians]|uniref:hypothetical protein n=1 Tax=Chitinophaga varians TaxID=2202339 RepID=UPI00165F97CF|nr:hypothetical protein [Chitinophaga varians]MBC9909132.1 hypothetical protein [Chitinophaga varians]
MKLLKFTVQCETNLIKVRLTKIQRKRMFKVTWEEYDKTHITVYAISDETNVLDYYEGAPMSLILHNRTIQMIQQYFTNTKAIMKIEEDDYDDYDDD